jgi:hypothetical protein
MQVNSDVHRYDIATHSLLGGQYGEESKESEEGQEEGQEEEVDLHRNNDAIDRDVDAASQGRRGRNPISANAAAVATSALVDDGGRRRNRGSSFTDTVFWFGFHGPIKSPSVLGRRKTNGIRGQRKTGDLSFSPMPSVAGPNSPLTRAARRGFLVGCSTDVRLAQPPFSRVLQAL